MEIIKKEYKSILLVLGYILVAELVYVSLAIIFLHEWYFGLIAGLLVFIIGLKFAAALCTGYMDNPPHRDR